MDQILEMPIFEAFEFLDAWSEMAGPDKPKKYLVKRPVKK
jgi:hypothetical protein